MKSQTITFLTSILLVAIVYIQSEGFAAEFRYQIIEKNGKFYRFDKQTGTFSPHDPDLVGDAGANEPGNNAPVINNAPIINPDLKQKHRRTLGQNISRHVSASMTDDGNQKPIVTNVTMPNVILRPVKEIPSEISDQQRKECRIDLNRYRKDIALIQTVQVKDGRLTGMIMVTNEGNRYMNGLELTLSVPVGTGKNRENHRFLLCAREGHELPPEPAPKGEDAEPQIIKVDVPAPAGGRGRIDVKATWVQFAG